MKNPDLLFPIEPQQKPAVKIASPLSDEAAIKKQILEIDKDRTHSSISITRIAANAFRVNLKNPDHKIYKSYLVTKINETTFAFHPPLQ